MGKLFRWDKQSVSWRRRYLTKDMSVSKEFRKYELDIFKGKIKCPYKIVFKNREEVIVSRVPIPLTPNGTPKFDLFEID